MGKESFIIYASFYKPISKLSDKQLGRLFRAIFRYHIDGVVAVEEDIEMAFAFFVNQFEIDESKYQSKVERNRDNGRKGGAPKGNRNAAKNSSETTQYNPSVEKTSENNPIQAKTRETTLNDNDNVNDNIEKIITQKEFCDVCDEHKASQLSEIERQFDSFRQRYPGKRRGFKAEFDNFKRKNPKTWREIIPLLNPALDRLLEWNERAQAAGQFVPGFKNLTTWLNQQCWTEEFPEIVSNQIRKKFYANDTQTQDRYAKRRGVDSAARGPEDYTGEV